MGGGGGLPGVLVNLAAFPSHLCIGFRNLCVSVLFVHCWLFLWVFWVGLGALGYIRMFQGDHYEKDTCWV